MMNGNTVVILECLFVDNLRIYSCEQACEIVHVCMWACMRVSIVLARKRSSVLAYKRVSVCPTAWISLANLVCLISLDLKNDRLLKGYPNQNRTISI